MSRRNKYNCAVCGQSYIGQGRKYCSYSCSGFAMRGENSPRWVEPTFKCEMCEAMFKAYPPQRSGRFCSRICYEKSREIQKKNCIVCEREYVPDKGGVEKWTASKYCSMQCLAIGNKTGQNVKCDNCGKNVWRKLFSLNATEHFFCSKDCFNEGGGKYRQGENNGMFGKTHTYFVRLKLSDCLSKRMRGRKMGEWSKGGKRKDLNDQYFRSSWEANYARYLNHTGIEWKYEIKTFKFPVKRGVMAYTPDFYLPVTGEYHEIKGWMTPKSKVAINRFNKYYPGENLVVVGKKEYDLIRREFSKVVPGWE